MSDPDGLQCSSHYLVNTSSAVNLHQDEALFIPFCHYLRLFVVKLKTVADYRFTVVRAASFLCTTQKAAYDLLVVNRQLEHDVEFLLTIAKELVKIADLSNRSRIAIKKKAVLDVALAQAVANHMVGDTVWNKITRVDVFLGLHTQSSFSCRMGTKNFTSGNGDQADRLEIPSACVPLPEQGGPIMSILAIAKNPYRAISMSGLGPPAGSGLAHLLPAPPFLLQLRWR